MFPLTEHGERFAEGTTVLLSGTPEGERGTVPATVLGSRLHKGRRLLRLDRIEDRTTAEQRAGWYLVIPREEADEARAEDEHFLHALVGRAVRTAEGSELGGVIDVVETNGPPLLEIGRPGEPRRRLLPFVRAFVREVTDEVVVVEPPEGWEEL